MTAAQSCAVVIGAGARKGIGAAVASLVAANGLHVFLAARSDDRLHALATEIRAAGGSASAIACDTTDPDQVTALFAEVADSGRRLELVVYNVGRNLPAPFLQADSRLIELNWRLSVYGGLLVGQAAVRQMLDQPAQAQHRGTVIYTGASASLRGKPMFSAFASAKAGLRAMAQSMAREFAPQGIHVGHVVIDGVVDGDIIRQATGVVSRILLRRKGADGCLQPAEIARNYWALYCQPASAWTHELDLRPHREPF